MTENKAPSPKISELDILWITAGLGCDGDTIAMTAATQPSLEDLLSGALPWLPKIYLHNSFLSFDNGEEFMAHFHAAAEGRSPREFILVVEGSIPNEKNKDEGYWATFGTDQKTLQPILTCEWLDGFSPKAWAVIAAGPRSACWGDYSLHRNIPPHLGV